MKLKNLLNQANGGYKETNFMNYMKISGKTDIYNYTVLNNQEIKFEMQKTAMEFNEPNYTFIDKRVNENVVSKTTDGLSIANAIKVKSVPEEYQYVKKNCANCKLLGQALIFEKDKPYDKISLKNEKGEEVSYYFDISSFSENSKVY